MYPLAHGWVFGFARNACSTRPEYALADVTDIARMLHALRTRVESTA
jgi:hypothetical protein